MLGMVLLQGVYIVDLSSVYFPGMGNRNRSCSKFHNSFPLPAFLVCVVLRTGPFQLSGSPEFMGQRPRDFEVQEFVSLL